MTLHKLLDSRDQAGPALCVTFAILGHWGQAAVRDLDLRAAGR